MPHREALKLSHPLIITKADTKGSSWTAATLTEGFGRVLADTCWNLCALHPGPLNLFENKEKAFFLFSFTFIQGKTPRQRASCYPDVLIHSLFSVVLNGGEWRCIRTMQGRFEEQYPLHPCTLINVCLTKNKLVDSYYGRLQFYQAC